MPIVSYALDFFELFYFCQVFWSALFFWLIFGSAKWWLLVIIKGTEGRGQWIEFANTEGENIASHSFGWFLETQNAARQERDVKNSLCDVKAFSFTSYSARSRNSESIFSIYDLYFDCNYDF